MTTKNKFEGSAFTGDARLINILNNTFNSGAKGLVGIFGDTFVAHRVPLFSTNFSYPANSKSVLSGIVGSGAIDYNVNLLRVSTGTTTGSKAVIASKRKLRYTAGRDAEAMFTAIFSDGVEGAVQRIGIFDTEDGFFIGFIDTDFVVVRRKDGEGDEVITQANFNGDTLDGKGASGYVLAPTMINIFRITYGYLGTAEIKYQIQMTLNNVTQWVTFHTIDRRNIIAETSIRIPYLPLCMEVDNGVTTENVITQTGSVYAGVLDGSGDDRAARSFSANATVEAVSGVDQRIAIFKSKDVFQGLENHIEANLIYFTAGIESNKPAIINIYKLPDQTQAGGTWVDVDTANSIMEYSLNQVIDLTDAELLISFALGKSSNIQEQIGNLFINLLPGEYAGITIDNITGGTADVSTTFRWKELF